MSELDPRLQQASAALEAGRHDEALALVRQAFAEVDGHAPTALASHFMTMFLWETLAGAYPPARAALAEERDAQVRRVLAGDMEFGPPAPAGVYAPRRSRFAVVVGMNETLADPASTHALFRALADSDPAGARPHAARALAAIVAVGDFALADRYRREPLAMLEAVNGNARTLPLLPPPGQAPRLAAEMMGLCDDVRIGIAVLDGLGRPHEAQALHAALLAGLESAELRALAQRELAQPGSINRAVVEHQMPHEMQRKMAQDGHDRAAP